jgi:pSer/pThr/pTyr-binding forkhead associated (FHA) protein
MAPAITLTIKNGKLAGTEYEFDLPRRCLIGRASDCELRLPSELEFLGVSRHHCLLLINPPEIRVRDCGSRNGTLLNGMQIGRPRSWQVPEEMAAVPFQDYELTNGDELKIGSVVFEVHASTPESRPEALPEAHPGQELCACT